MNQVKRMMSYPRRMFERLTRFSNHTGLALTEIVRRAVDEYLDRNEVK